MVQLDSKIVMQVKHLVWKFRGKSTISVDGIPVEVYWDVHNWLFGSPAGNAFFMFQMCAGADKSGSFVARTVTTNSETLNTKSPLTKQTDVKFDR